MQVLSILDTKIGILGGGQLGKMLIQAGHNLGLNIRVMDKDPYFPAGKVCRNFLEGDFKGYDDVMFFGSSCDILTVEIENVNTKALADLEKKGVKVFPQAHILDLIKDKGKQKQYYLDNNIPSSSFLLLKNRDEILENINAGNIRFPFVQKATTGGYDGRGVQIINSDTDLDKIMDTTSVIEENVSINKEISVVVARSASGEIKSYPVVEMQFNNANLVDYLFAPSTITEKQEKEAITIAEDLANKLEIVGLLAVELFLDTHGNILVNEVAPRPHNSGHHTIEACPTSQFEQHLRAILGLPLGDTQLISAAAMLNVIGHENYTGKAIYQGIEECLGLNGVHVHIYGKEITKPNRKMGHITICDKDMQLITQKLRFIKDNLIVKA